MKKNKKRRKGRKAKRSKKGKVIGGGDDGKKHRLNTRDKERKRE